MKETDPHSLANATFVHEFHEAWNQVKNSSSITRADFCAKFLEKLSSSAQTSGREESSRPTPFALAYVNVKLANALDAAHNPGGAESTLRKVLTDVEPSGDNRAIYHILYALGLFYWQDRPELSVFYFQRAIVHAQPNGTGGINYEIINCIDWLARIWAKDSATYSSATLMYNWLCIIKPAPLEVLVDKYECYIKHGNIEAVKEAKKLAVHDDCLSKATAAAAFRALNQHRKACQTAREGALIAASLEDTAWSLAFKFFLDQAPCKIGEQNRCVEASKA